MSAFSSALTSLFTACAAAPKRKRKSEMDRSGSRLPQLRGGAASSARSPLEGKGGNSPVSRVGMRLAERPKSMYDIPVSLVDAASPGQKCGAEEYAAAASARPTRLQLQAHQPKACAPVPCRGSAASGAPAEPHSTDGQHGSHASHVDHAASPPVDSSDCRSNGRSLASGELQNAGKVGSTFGFAGSNGVSRPSSRSQQEPNASRLAFRSPSAAVAKSVLPGASAAPTGLRPVPAHGHQVVGSTAGSNQPTELPGQQQHNVRQCIRPEKVATDRDGCNVGSPVSATAASEPLSNGAEPDGSSTALRTAADASGALVRRPASLGTGRTAIGGGRRPGDRRSTAGIAAPTDAGRVSACDGLGGLSSSKEADELDRQRSAAAEALLANGQTSDCRHVTSDDTVGKPVVLSELAVAAVAKPLATAAAAPTAHRQSRFGLRQNLGTASRKDDFRTGKVLQPSGEQPHHSRLNGSHSGASSLSNLSELGQNTHLTCDDDRASPLLNGSDSLTTLTSGRSDDAHFESSVNVLALQDNVSMQLMLLEMADEVRALRAGLSELQRELQHEETMRHRLQLECAEKDTCIADLRRQLGKSTS